jgi:PAS domain S-box-containing protein
MTDLSAVNASAVLTRRAGHQSLLLSALLVAAATFAADVFSAPGIIGSLPYVLCLLILSRLQIPHWLFGGATGGTVLAIVAYLLKDPATAASQAAAANLALSIGVLWAAAILLHARQDLADAEQNSRLALLVEGAFHAKLLTDADGRILASNAEAERVFGYSRQELIGSPVELLLPEAAGSAHRRMRKEYSRHPSPRSMGRGRDLYGLRKDGSRVPIEIGLNPLRENGLPVVLATITDITERKRMEAENELLVRELGHRVKNSLSLASSIASLTARTASNQDEFLEIFTARLQALSRGQSELMSRMRNAADLGHVVHREIEIMGVEDRVASSGPAILLNPEQAGPLALAVHELATNAFKHGALSEPSGSVEINWVLDARHGASWARLTWRETGGPVVVVPKRRGFGTVLIEHGIPEAEVTCTFEPCGFRCEINLPVKDAIVEAGGRAPV